jgi:hypothetical protein
MGGVSPLPTIHYMFIIDVMNHFRFWFECYELFRYLHNSPVGGLKTMFNLQNNYT